MSESNPPQILKRKRGRSRHQKISVNTRKYKLIPKSIKIGKKPKANSRQINVIKPKPIKKNITYRNYPQSNIDSLNQVEKTYQDEEKEFKKDDTCQENSLGQLTKNFINYIKATGKKSININDLVNELSVKKRRIYDITNVLQGIGYLQKSGKNEIIWTKTVKNKKNSKKKFEKIKKSNNNCNIQKSNIEQLEQENARLDEEIKNFRNEFNSIAKKSEFLKYGYVSMDDLKKISINNKKDLYIIKASKGTVMNILDKDDIKIAYNNSKKAIEKGEESTNELLLSILKKKNQISFNCPENSRLFLYNIIKGEAQELDNNTNNNGPNISKPQFVNNNINLNNYNISFNRDNINPINNNNFNYFFSNKEEKDYNNHINKNNFPKNLFVNSNEAAYNNVKVNNEQNNIKVLYSTPSKPLFGQSQFSSSKNNFDYYNYKNTAKKYNDKNKIIKRYNNNLVEERFHIEN